MAELRAHRVRGRGLEPRFCDGEFLIVKPDHKPATGNEVVVGLSTGDLLIRKFVAAGAGQLSVRPIGGEWTLEALSAQMVDTVDCIVGRVADNPGWCCDLGPEVDADM